MATKKKSYTKKTTSPKKEVLATQETVTYNKTKLVCRISAEVKLQGSITGKFYRWEKAGAVVEVDERDASALLKKRLGEKHCCGGKPNIIFEEVD